MARTIYITSTEEVSTDLIDQVTGLLNQVKGDLFFSALPCVPNWQVRDFCKDFEKKVFLTFDELFIICNLIRIIHKLDKEATCVLLTGKRNASNWFSACSEQKNIFVDVTDWDTRVEKSAQWGTAYQIIENVFQSLLGTYYTNLENNPTFHPISNGCINDFCRNKPELMCKLRTADICGVCIHYASNKHIPATTLKQISDTINLLRNNLVNSFKRDLAPLPLTVRADGSIYIGNRLINLEPLPKTLFIFFLRQRHPIRLEDLLLHQNEIGEIYRIIRPVSANPMNTVYSMILPYHDPNTTFSRHKSVVNRELINQLGDSMADFYSINRDDEGAFSIRLDFDRRTIGL